MLRCARPHYALLHRATLPVLSWRYDERRWTGASFSSPARSRCSLRFFLFFALSTLLRRRCTITRCTSTFPSSANDRNEVRRFFHFPQGERFLLLLRTVRTKGAHRSSAVACSRRREGVARKKRLSSEESVASFRLPYLSSDPDSTNCSSRHLATTMTMKRRRRKVTAFGQSTVKEKQREKEEGKGVCRGRQRLSTAERSDGEQGTRCRRDG
jgi:hypothetical protein